MRVSLALITVAVSVAVSTGSRAIGEGSGAATFGALNALCAKYKGNGYRFPWQPHPDLPAGMRLCGEMMAVCGRLAGLAGSSERDRCRLLNRGAGANLYLPQWCDPDGFARRYESIVRSECSPKTAPTDDLGRENWLRLCRPTASVGPLRGSVNPDCLKACDQAGHRSLPLEDLLPLEHQAHPKNSQPTFAQACADNWEAALPDDAKAKIGRCMPSREVIDYAMRLENTFRRKARDIVKEYEMPVDAAGLLQVSNVTTTSPLPRRRRFIETHLELIDKVIDCPKISDRNGAKTVAGALKLRASANLVEIAELERKEAEAQARRVAELRARREQEAPGLRKAFRCPHCSVDQAFDLLDKATAVCVALGEKRSAERELRTLRSYGRKHGVVDLAELKEQSDGIREADETIRTNDAAYRSIAKHKFSEKECDAADHATRRLGAAGLLDAR